MGLFDIFKKKNNEEINKQEQRQDVQIEPVVDTNDSTDSSTFHERIDEKLDNVNDFVEKAIDVIIETFEDYQEKQQSGIETHITRDIFSNVKEKIDTRLDKANDIIEDVIDVIIETFEEKRASEQDGTKIKITRELLRQKFDEKHNGTPLDTENAKVNSTIDRVAEIINNESNLENAVEEVTKLVGNTFENVTNLIEETTEELTEQAEEFIKDIQEDLEETIEEIKEDSLETIEEVITETEEQIEEIVEPKESLFAKMKKGLLKTKDNLTQSIDNVFKAFTKIDDDFYDELEETLILSDLGARTSMDIIEQLRSKVKEQKLHDTMEVKALLIEIITEILNKDETPLETPSPTVILVIGVNGVGKTTTIGKLASLYKQEGKNVLLAAGDTFRAAAIEQLEEWGNRSEIPVIKHAENSDSSAVIYDAIQSAKAKKADLLICDTAGRLHNKKNLMAELEKINRVINKEYADAHLETFLVLDGTSGQNAIEQAKQFNEVCDITGLVLTKLDGTAKGGVVISIKNELNIPVRFVGVGERISDLQHFNAEFFSKALFDAE